MTPHLSDVAGKGDDPVRRWQKAVFGRVFSRPRFGRYCCRELRESFRRSKTALSGLSGGSYLNGLTPPMSVWELLGFGNNCLWSQVHHGVNKLIPLSTLTPYVCKGASRSLCMTEREQVLVKAQADAPGSTPSSDFPGS